MGSICTTLTTSNRPSDATENRTNYPNAANRPYVPPPASPPKRTVLVAIFPYKSTGDGDITFKVGDLMILLNDTNPDWAYVQHTITKDEGYARKGYFAVQGSLECEEFYFSNISRMDAENLLLQHDLPYGTFLIRESSQGDYALSVRCESKQYKQQVEIHHYHIRITNDHRFVMTVNGQELRNGLRYNSLSEIIEGYKRKGLHLVMSCPKIAPRLCDFSPRTKENYEIAKSDITKIKWLGKASAIYYIAIHSYAFHACLRNAVCYFNLLSLSYDC